MNKDQIKELCAIFARDSEYSRAIEHDMYEKPFYFEGYIVASDGHAMVCIPAAEAVYAEMFGESYSPPENYAKILSMYMFDHGGPISKVFRTDFAYDTTYINGNLFSSKNLGRAQEAAAIIGERLIQVEMTAKTNCHSVARYRCGDCIIVIAGLASEG